MLLVFLCALTRTANPGKLSALGVFGPLSQRYRHFWASLAFVFLISLKIEADVLFLARESVLEEASKLSRNAARVRRGLSTLRSTIAGTRIQPLKRGSSGRGRRN